MSLTDSQLILRLAARNADRSAATDNGGHSKKRVPCVTASGLDAVEKSLGFPLPALIRSLYSEVGNGGFGPEYGIVGTKVGAKLDGYTLESCYAWLLSLGSDNSAWQWPHRLLPLANYGCGMWSCVDLTYQRHPLILWDPNNLDDELEDDEARLNWSHSFWDQGLSLKKSLVNWLNGTEDFDPKRPTASWTRKRLGFKIVT